MAATELLRDFKGQLVLYSNGRPVHGAAVSGVTLQDGIQQAVVLIPMAKLTVGEMNNVVPFPLPAPAVDLTTR